jgi:hypothetical protein
LRAGFSTTTSFPFLFSRPISTDGVRNTNAARKKQLRQIVEHLASAWREDAAGAAAAWGCGCVVGLRRGARRRFGDGGSCGRRWGEKQAAAAASAGGAERCRCARAALGEREGARRRLGTAALCAGERRREVAARRRTSRAAAARRER